MKPKQGEHDGLHIPGKHVEPPRVLEFVRRFGVALAPAVLALAGLLAHALLPGPAAARQLQIPWLPRSVQSWEPQIVDAARQHGVDPELLAIVMLVESGGNAGATSRVGARGLVQVMPSTAADVANRRGLVPPHPFGLYDPVINLDYGAWYLASQLQTFEHDGDAVELAAAAYNGGPGRVRAWLRGQGSLPAETQRYKELVSALYRERRDPDSPTFTALARRRSIF